MAIEVFNRFEQKYIINHETFLRVNDVIKKHMKPDVHSAGDIFYPILNIYYDTEDCALIRASVSKPAYKEKLRLRSYGRAQAGGTVYLEIKKKYHGLVNKRRTAIKLDQAEKFVESGIPPCPDAQMNLQVLRELAYFVNLRHLVPKAFIAYDRIAYFGEGNDSDLRISFDRNLRARSTNLSLAAPDTGTPILDGGLYICEVKTRFAEPLWLTGLFTSENLHRQSFSKYGSYYLETRSIPSANQYIA